MPIKFKYDLAAVPAISNQTTRRFGQSLVEQQRQQNFSGQQLRQQLGARDFQNATSNMSSYLQDMLDNNEITDEPTRRRLLALRSGVDTVMGSGFTDDQRRHYLNQYNSQIAGILANAPVKAKPTRDDELKGFLGSNYDKYKDQPWVPDGKGGFTIADIPQPEQPKLPEPPKPQPKTFGEYYQMEPENARKMLADKMAEIRDEISTGEGSIAPYKSVQDKALAELEKPFQIMQDKFGQPTQAPPSAGALPAPTTGANTDPGFYRDVPPGANTDPGFFRGGSPTTGASTGGSQGNVWGGIAQASGPLPAWRTEGRQFTYSSQPDVGDMRGAPEGKAQPGNTMLPVQPTQDGSGWWDQIMGDVRSQGQGGPMTQEQFSADAAGRQPYQSRIDATRAEADAMSNKTDRAESALRGELLPRSPQGERPSSMYDISAAQDKREADQFAQNKAEYDKYKAKRAEGDAALKKPTDPDIKPIANPKTMKQDARKFSSEYQLYKRGGGTLSTRDYILQMAKQGQLSDDLKAQLENNYGMDLSDPALAKVKEQDVLSQQDTVKAEAKTKRDAEDTRRKYARGMPIAQKATAPAAAAAPAAAPGGKYGPTTPPAPSSSATQPVDEEQRALAQKLRIGDRGTGEIDDGAYAAAWSEWVDKYGNQEEAEKYFEKADELYKSNGGVATDEWQELLRKARAAQMGPYDQFPDQETAPSSTATPPATATPGAVPGKQTAPAAAPALPQAPKPDFEAIANTGDDDERALIAKLQPIYDSQSPDVQNAINVVFGESSLDEDVARALAYLKSKGILTDELTAPSVPPPVGRRGNPGTTPPKPANKGGMGPFPKPTGGRRGKQY